MTVTTRIRPRRLRRRQLWPVGRTLKPKVFCVLEGADQGAGHPDYALYTARQVQRGRPREGQVPERGVVEVKGVGEDAWLTAESDQVSRYWGHYRLVLVTNLRDFVLVGADGSGGPARLEPFRLAEDADDFWSKVERPRAFAREVGAGLGEYLARRSRTRPPWPSRRTSRGSSPRTPATACPGWRRRGTPIPRGGSCGGVARRDNPIHSIRCATSSVVTLRKLYSI